MNNFQPPHDYLRREQEMTQDDDVILGPSCPHGVPVFRRCLACDLIPETPIDWQARCAELESQLQKAGKQIEDEQAIAVQFQQKADELLLIVRNVAHELLPDRPQQEAEAEFLFDGMGACQIIRRMRKDRAELAAIKGRRECKHADTRVVSRGAFDQDSLWCTDCGAHYDGYTKKWLECRTSTGPWEPSEPSVEVQG